MGVILDSSVVIAAKPRGNAVEELSRRLFAAVGDQLTELFHGIYRAQTPEIRQCRQGFFDEILGIYTVYPYTKETALLAARVDGEPREKCVTIPFDDLLIGATALSLGLPVLTENPRHFRLIPGVNTISF
jgi:predicted nucleic acid-binding protein